MTHMVSVSIQTIRALLTLAIPYQCKHYKQGLSMYYLRNSAEGKAHREPTPTSTDHDGAHDTRHR